jgi:hypothetical protein
MEPLGGDLFDGGVEDLSEAILPSWDGGFAEEPLAGVEAKNRAIRGFAVEDVAEEGIGIAGGVEPASLASDHRFLKAAGGCGEDGLGVVVGLKGDEAEGFPPGGGDDDGSAASEGGTFGGATELAKVAKGEAGSDGAMDVGFHGAGACELEHGASLAQVLTELFPGGEEGADAFLGDEATEEEVAACILVRWSFGEGVPGVAEGVNAMGWDACVSDELVADEVRDGDPGGDGVEPAGAVESLEEEGEEGGLQDGALPGGLEDFSAVVASEGFSEDARLAKESAGDGEGAEVVKVVDDWQTSLVSGVEDGG